MSGSQVFPAPTTNPVIGSAAVTTSDTVDLPKIPRALWVDVGGNIKVTLLDGTTDTFTVLAGLLPFCVRRVWATGTTATGIHALY